VNYQHIIAFTFDNKTYMMLVKQLVALLRYFLVFSKIIVAGMYDFYDFSNVYFKHNIAYIWLHILK